MTTPEVLKVLQAVVALTEKVIETEYTLLYAARVLLLQEDAPHDEWHDDARVLVQRIDTFLLAGE